MSKGKDFLDAMFQKLFDENPDLKREHDAEMLAIRLEKQKLVESGMDDADAHMIAWNNHWTRVKEETGFEFSIGEIDKNEKRGDE